MARVMKRADTIKTDTSKVDRVPQPALGAE
jgi:hypothetical protein